MKYFTERAEKVIIGYYHEKADEIMNPENYADPIS